MCFVGPLSPRLYKLLFGFWERILHTCRLTSAEKFLVLACDGLFTAFTPQELVDVTAKYIKEGYAAAEAEERRLEKNAMRVVADEDRIKPLEEAARRLVKEVGACLLPEMFMCVGIIPFFALLGVYRPQRVASAMTTAQQSFLHFPRKQ